MVVAVVPDVAERTVLLVKGSVVARRSQKQMGLRGQELLGGTVAAVETDPVQRTAKSYFVMSIVAVAAAVGVGAVGVGAVGVGAVGVASDGAVAGGDAVVVVAVYAGALDGS